MAIPVARVHLKMAQAAFPALLPTPPKSKMLPVLPMPFPCVAAILRKPPARPGRSDSDERWDARKRKTRPAGAEPTSDNVRSIAAAGHGSSPRKNATSPPPMPGRADSVGRWDAHKKAASPASSPSSSGTSSLLSISKRLINNASSAEPWDVHKRHRPPQAKLLDDGESSSSSNDDIDTEEVILWKPRAMYAGPGFVVAAPEPMLPMPTAFLVPVA